MREELKRDPNDWKKNSLEWKRIYALFFFNNPKDFHII